MIRIRSNTAAISYLVKSQKFSGGELHINIKDFLDKVHSSRTDHCTLCLDVMILSSDTLMELLLVTNAIRVELKNVHLHLYMMYLPYARQDRVCAEGDAFSFEVFANIINSQNYTSVTCLDPHNLEVAKGLIRNLFVRDVSSLARLIVARHNGYDYIVAPDHGGLERASRFLEEYNRLAKKPASIVIGSKVRNPETGELSNAKIDAGDLKGGSCLIVDDICDGGRTFYNLGVILGCNGASDIDLLVSHGIFTKGTGYLGFRHIYTTDSLPEKDDGRIVIKRYYY